MIKKRRPPFEITVSTLTEDEVKELYNIYKSESGATLYIPKNQDAEAIKAEIGAVKFKPISKTKTN